MKAQVSGTKNNFDRGCCDFGKPVGLLDAIREISTVDIIQKLVLCII